MFRIVNPLTISKLAVLLAFAIFWNIFNYFLLKLFHWAQRYLLELKSGWFFLFCISQKYQGIGMPGCVPLSEVCVWHRIISYRFAPELAGLLFLCPHLFVLPLKGSLDNGVNNLHIKQVPRCLYLWAVVYTNFSVFVMTGVPPWDMRDWGGLVYINTSLETHLDSH